MDRPRGAHGTDNPRGRYAVFEFPCEDIGQTWDYIHGQWFPNSEGYALAGSPVFEYYPKSNTTETHLQIWVPVRPKE